MKAMTARHYNRQSFEDIRQAERVRFQALQRVQLDFGLGESWLASAVESGTDPAEARAARDQLLADEGRRADGSAIVALAAGPLGGPPAAELVCRAWFARPDAAEAIGVVEGQRVEFSGRPRDALARVAGITGQGADPWFVYQMAERSGTIVTGPVGRVDLSMTGRPLTSSGLPAALRDALDSIVRVDWRRSGAFWRASAMMIDGIDYRPRRFWLAQGSVQDAEITAEAGEPVHSPDGGGGGWRYADLQVRRRREETLLSRTRMINVGGVELSSWISARLALWHDGLDRQVADLLATSAAVRTNAGGFDAEHFASAVAGLNRQMVGGVPLGSSRPIALCGEGRRVLMSAVPGPARATGDEAAVLSRVVYSASVDPDFLCLVHPEHAPLVIGGLGGRLDPEAAVGAFAGVMQDGEASMRGAVVSQDRSDPALCVDGETKCVGAVRMIA